MTVEAGLSPRAPGPADPGGPLDSRGAARRRILAGRLSLRLKLVLGMALPLLGLTVGGLGFLIAAENRHQLGTQREVLRSVVVAMTNDFHRVTLLNDQSVGVEIADRLRAFTEIDRLCLLDEHGVMAYSYARSGLLPEAPPVGEDPARSRWFEVALTAGGQPIGVAVLQASPESHRAAAAARTARALGVAGGLFVACLAVALGVGRTISSPIRRIRDFVVETARTLDTTRRIEIDDGHEIGALGGSINRLLEEIATQRAELAATNARIEAEVEQRTRELRATERRLRAMATHAPVGIFETDREGRCIFVNRTWGDITGCGPDRALGRPWTEAVNTQDGERVRREWAAAAERNEEYNTECRMAGADDRAAWVCASTIALRGDGGSVIGHLGTITDITDRKRMEDELRFGALHDKLTGLPNRASIREQLARTLERSREDPSFRYALLYLDFDRFKAINDTMGHEAGDAFLTTAAERLTGRARARSAERGTRVTPARLGGDEFVVLVEGPGADEDAPGTAEDLCAALATPYAIHGKDVHSSASIGVVRGAPEYGTPDDVLRDADAAMYYRKAHGRKGVTVFEPAMREAALSRARFEKELRGALDRDELFLVYQPIVSLEHRGPVAFESLLRWRHPTAGQLAPGAFIGVAEETGQIIPIGRWVLREACRQARQWQTWMPDPEPLGISVNIARRHLEQGSLVTDVREALDASGLSPSCLILEITESSIMKDIEGSIRVLTSLRELGVRVAMDDFGAGHSSLACLRRLPLDILKIDSGFITGITADRRTIAIIHAIMTMAANFRLVVVGEGVETDDELATLLAVDCPTAQGYFFGRPMAASEVPAWCVRAAAPTARAA